MALLDLMHDALFGTSSKTQRKMFFRVHVLYIDEGETVYGWSKEVHEQNLNLIRTVCENYNFTYSILPIESIYDISSQLVDLKQPSQAEKDQF